MRESGGHPELSLEQARLEETLAAMERAIVRPIRRTGGADEEAVIALAIQRAWYREELRQALAAPYFARLDFHLEGGAGPQTFYIGKTHFAAEGWRSPAGRPPWPPSSTAPPGRRPPIWPRMGRCGAACASSGA